MTEKEIWSKIIEEAESLLSSERLSNSYINNCGMNGLHPREVEMGLSVD